jgi:predicted phage-related endonuclease
LVKRYKELFEKLHYYSCDEKEKADIKKYLEKKLSVEFYCRGMVALTKEQKKEVEKMVKSAVKEAGVDKFKFKLLSATYR